MHCKTNFSVTLLLWVISHVWSFPCLCPFFLNKLQLMTWKCERNEDVFCTFLVGTVPHWSIAGVFKLRVDSFETALCFLLVCFFKLLLYFIKYNNILYQIFLIIWLYYLSICFHFQHQSWIHEFINLQPSLFFGELNHILVRSPSSGRTANY